jgi:MoaA/NifB/PqqE/SkfB family radical SAM enzyme
MPFLTKLKLDTISKLNIQWSISNQCNLSCSYCPVPLKHGNIPFPSRQGLDIAFREFNRISEYYTAIVIEITGGEPSLSNDLQNIMVKNQNPKIKYRLLSNGYASIDWWIKVKNKLESLTFTYHSQRDLGNFLELLLAVRDINPLILLPIQPESWTDQLLVYNKFKQLGFKTQLQMLYKNFTQGNNIYLDYTKDQWKFYFSERNIIEEVSLEFKRTKNLNNFYGHMCWAGVEQIIINFSGQVYNGWCLTEYLGNIFENEIDILPSPKPCPKLLCVNGFDLQARKSKGSWGFS